MENLNANRITSFDASSVLSICYFCFYFFLVILKILFRVFLESAISVTTYIYKVISLHSSVYYI